ncbi:serine hydroxymethyltransferase [candidate division WOR-3 bacterium JGI_Cruoil_03_51_56]|uniref:Serine hydroxymethyltransferase n=1 Tax=candidate division WOR-3 bacterium JGI_Cruoil_03_51_56 TaxID=1973747 RepID=A0A235BNW9_UNCW3|nr:MAG: serine hydroxymethyltransferase [candidate division WOR-3 bacterium JGI_Cruoil_03_51_56]
MKPDLLKTTDPEVFEAIRRETNRQHNNLELIASENFCSEAVLAALGSVLTNKYAEGYPKRRYYGGCRFVDIGENLAIERAKKLFGCDHANVQPHAGTQANIAAYLTLANPGDTIMGLSLAHGGHLSHGHPVNFSGLYFKAVQYTVDPKTETFNYAAIRKLALECKPRVIVSGASAYSRTIHFDKFQEICDEVGASQLADIAHIAGPVAAGLHPSPIPYADIVTTTTHKTLRGPRGAIMMCKEKYAERLDKMVFPGNQGGPLEHCIAAKAVAFKEALTPEFKQYQRQTLANAKALAEALASLGFRIVSGGTDNHMLLVDLRPKNITGRDAERALGKVRITVNRNTIPFDPQKPFIASGIRLGTPALTTRGMKEPEMKKIAGFIDRTVTAVGNEETIAKIKAEVKELVSAFPLYQERRAEYARLKETQQ